MSEPLELHSPFQLLDEVDETKEVLILSYTADLAFFERFALSHTRALGAVVTLISDARMVGDDPMVVRQAGTTYLPGRAICPGTAAFHPKMVILVGEKEARVAVGSGNLTLVGWHGNAEIWTVLRGGTEGAPDTIAAVAGFLRDLLDSPIRLGPGCSEALGRVAAASVRSRLPMQDRRCSTTSNGRSSTSCRAARSKSLRSALRSTMSGWQRWRRSTIACAQPA